MRSFFLLLACAVAATASEELFDAARTGDVQAVKAALEKGTPVDATWRYGQTALFIAASRGHTDIVNLLLDKGASPNVKDTFYGMTALQVAMQKDALDTIALLLEKGAPGGDQVLITAAGQGKEKLVAGLLQRPGWKPEVLTNALAAAEGAKHEPAAKLLRDAGAKPREPVTVPAETLAKYVGTYRRDSNDLKVELTDGKLHIGGSGLPMMECRMLDQTTCEPVRYAGQLKAAFTAEGLEIRQGDTTQLFTRIEASSK